MLRSIRSAAVVLALVAATASTAVAEPSPGIGANSGVAGFVLATTSGLLPPDGTKTHGDDDGYDLTGKCSFAIYGVGTTIFVRYHGTITASGPEVAGATVIKCRIYNKVGQSASATTGLNGPVGAVASVTGPWAPSPITVCVSGFSAYTPSAHIETLNERCEEPDL